MLCSIDKVIKKKQLKPNFNIFFNSIFVLDILFWNDIYLLISL